MTLMRGPGTTTLRTKALGEILREQGSISLDFLSQALESQAQHGGMVGQILVKMKACTTDNVGEALQKQIKITDVKLAQAQIRISAATLCTRAFCEENKLIPFETAGKLLCIAMANPLNRNCIIDLEKTLKDLSIKTFRAPWPEIHKTIERAFTAAEQKKSRIQLAIQLDSDGNPLPSSTSASAGGPTAVAVANRPVRPLSGLNMHNAQGQPGFERPPSVRQKAMTEEPAAAEGASAAAPRPATGSGSPASSGIRNVPAPAKVELAPRASAIRPAVVPVTQPSVDGSWLETKQNPHVVFHQRMVKTMTEIAGAAGFMSQQIPDDQRQRMITTLGCLIAEHGALLRDTANFTLAAETLKQLDWRTSVLRGLFCYHLSFPCVFGANPKAFLIQTPQDARDSYEKVRGHLKLFLKELNSLRPHVDNLVYVSSPEIDDTVARVERVYLLLPNAQPNAV